MILKSVLVTQNQDETLHFLQFRQQSDTVVKAFKLSSKVRSDLQMCCTQPTGICVWDTQKMSDLWGRCLNMDRSACLQNVNDCSSLLHYHFVLSCYQPDFLLLGKITSCIRGSFLQLSCGRSYAGSDPLVPYSCLHGCTRRFSCLHGTRSSGLQLNIPHSMPNSHRPEA